MKIFESIDNFLNQITMYRLTMYGLIFLLCAGFVFSFFGLLPFAPVSLIFSALLLTLFCLVINYVFAYIYKAPTNTESVYITAFILALIITPSTSVGQILFLAWASLFAMGSKYLLAAYKKHLFNPAALSVAVTGLLLHQFASWWVGNFWTAPWMFIIGFLITRKIKRWDLVLSFFITSTVLVAGYTFFHHNDVVAMIREMVLYSPLMFLGFIMLSEPTTTPPTRNLRILYGVFVSFFFVPVIQLLYFSPEVALVIGNVFSYIVSPKDKLILKLKEKMKVATNTYDFVFHPDRKLAFKPGQYLEWTLAHERPDLRGMRRYFTIASSPTESDIRMGVKFYDKPSTYKKALDSLGMQGTIVASQLAGDFVLPKDARKKLVFIAGGIGVTPFRSMVKYLLDTNQKRDIVIFYANSSYQDIAYKEIFDQACQKLGIKIIYTLNNLTGTPPDFKHEEGFISQKMIEQIVPDFKERMFYISGPHTMITSFEKTLKDMGIGRSHIKTDFFPGFA